MYDIDSSLLRTLPAFGHSWSVSCFQHVIALSVYACSTLTHAHRHITYTQSEWPLGKASWVIIVNYSVKLRQLLRGKTEQVGDFQLQLRLSTIKWTQPRRHDAGRRNCPSTCLFQTYYPSSPYSSTACSPLFFSQNCWWVRMGDAGVQLTTAERREEGKGGK